MIIQKIFQTVIIAVFFLLVAGIIIRIYPFKEFTFSRQPYQVITKQVKAGGALQFEIEYCKLSNASGEITQIWDGASRKVVPLGIYQGNKGCAKTISTVSVPPDLLPGIYTLHGHGEYDKWLVGKAKVDTYTVEFEISK